MRPIPIPFNDFVEVPALDDETSRGAVAVNSPGWLDWKDNLLYTFDLPLEQAEVALRLMGAIAKLDKIPQDAALELIASIGLLLLEHPRKTRRFDGAEWDAEHYKGFIMSPPAAPYGLAAVFSWGKLSFVWVGLERSPRQVQQWENRVLGSGRIPSTR